MNPGLSPVFAYLRQPTLVDFPGRLAAVFFTSGCNFTCGFCHNASLMGKMRPGLSWEKLDAACSRFRENWVTGAAVTGGEPTLAEDLFELIAFFQERGLAVKIDTNGTRPDVVRELVARAESVAMDVKASLEAYPELTGWRDTDRIRASADWVRRAPGGVLRTTIIEPFHTDDMMRAIGTLIEGVETYQMQAFVPREDLPGEPYRTLRRTSAERLEHLRDLMKPFARQVVIRG